MELMKRHFAPSLFALSLCALLGGARAAEAQDANAIVPTPIDSAAVPALDNAEAPVVAASAAARGAFTPLNQPSAAMFLRAQAPLAEEASTAGVAFQGRSWRMPSSRTLMIAGVAAVAIGLFAIEGDTGAIVALAGGGVAVYGLYLHYNR